MLGVGNDETEVAFVYVDFSETVTVSAVHGLEDILDCLRQRQPCSCTAGLLSIIKTSIEIKNYFSPNKY